MKVKEHSIKKILNSSSKPWIILLFSSLIIIYLFSLAEFLVQSPSNNFSNGLYIDTVDYGAIKNMRTAVVSEVSNEGITTVVAIDGHKTKLIQLDDTGQVILSKQIQLDLYNIKDVSLTVTSSSTITLFYMEKSLHQVNLNIFTEDYIDKVIAEQIDSYMYQDTIVCIKEKEGLSIAQLESKDFVVEDDWLNSNLAFIPLLSDQIPNPIISYAMDVSDKKVTIVYNGEDAIVHSISTRAPFNAIEKRTLDTLSDIEIKYFREIKDVLTFDNQVIVLFTYINKRFQINTLSIVRYDRDIARPIQVMQHDFTIQKGTIELDSVNKNSVVVILQDFVHYGVNVIKTIWQDPQTILIEPLTKTKIYSVEGDYDTTNKVSRLIFSDREADKRFIYYASSQPELIQSTSRLSHVNPLQLSVVSILVMVMSVLPSITTYFIKTALAPGILLFIITKTVPEYRYKHYVNLAVVGVVQYGLTLVMSTDVMKQWSSLQLLPLGINQPSVIYLLLAVIALIAYSIIACRHHRHRTYEKSPLISYLIYLVTVYIAYVLLIVVYIYTELIVAKV